MKFIYAVLGLAAILSSCQSSEAPRAHQPAPTEIAPNIEEGADAGSARLAWIERMHKTAPGISWRAIEARNSAASVSRLRKHKASLSSRGAATDSIAPGLYGKWHERGSDNQAGSVLATAYHAATDKVYAISAGGTLWSGPSDGSNWQVLNQDFQFEDAALALLSDGSGATIIVSAINAQPAVSTDNGMTWTVSNDLPEGRDNWAYLSDITITTENGNTVLYALQSESYFELNQLIKSTDNGYNWSVVASGLPLGTLSNEINLQPHPTGGYPILLTTEGDIALLTESGVRTVGAHPTPARTNGRLRLTASATNDALYLYTYNSDLRVYVSADTGATWQQKGTLPQRPWDVGIFANPTDPNQLLMGAVEAFTSLDGGESWNLVNTWGAYYSNVEGALHADMMTFNTFVKTDGTAFTLSANHGGLNSSSNWFRSSRNIGMQDLNVGQFYSVAYHENYPDEIFGGTQDQGFQVGFGSFDEIISMDQRISGDYGHLTFTQDGEELWMMYPGTAVSVYENPATGGYSDWLTINSTDETVWLAPMAAHPDPSNRSIFAAGGSVDDGGSGSYLINFRLDQSTGNIIGEDLPFNFNDGSGVLSAVAISPLATDRIYVATDEGRFLISEDTGETWTESISFLPDGHYLYGQAIQASPVLDSTVWLAGSGYSRPGVWRSDDLGGFFAADVFGLPATMVFELAASPDGKYLFAATEAGPYVQIIEERRWYPLAVTGVPNQAYWSVVYVPEDSIVRFGTYGRGIWDLKLQAAPVISSSARVANIDVQLFPNPTSDYFTLKGVEAIEQVRVLDVQGREVLSFRQNLTQPLDVRQLPAGAYLIEVRTPTGIGTKQLILR